MDKIRRKRKKKKINKRRKNMNIERVMTKEKSTS